MNFRTIILPEALKIIQSQDPSVFTILSQLENILSETGHPLDAIITQLEMLHRNAVMGLKVNGIIHHCLKCSEPRYFESSNSNLINLVGQFRC